MMYATKSREEFYKWLESRDCNPVAWLKDAYWEVWKASRGSVEVDIDWPEANDDFWKDGEDGAYATGHTDGRQQTTDAVVKALRTAGIRIKGESE